MWVVTGKTNGLWLNLVHKLFSKETASEQKLYQKKFENDMKTWKKWKKTKYVVLEGKICENVIFRQNFLKTCDM